MVYEVDWAQTLEFQKVWLSWPPLAAIMLAVFFWHFHAEIRTFLTNIRPKGLGFEPLFVEQSVDPTPQPSDADDWAEAAATAADAAADQSAIAEALKAEREEHFRYLNHLLVLTSQWLLNILDSKEEMTMDEFTSGWPELSPQNRQSILTVLYQHNLIGVEEAGIRITEKGREYVAWPERRAWVNIQFETIAPRTMNALRPMTDPSFSTAMGDKAANALTGRRKSMF